MYSNIRAPIRLVHKNGIRLNSTIVEASANTIINNSTIEKEENEIIGNDEIRLNSNGLPFQNSLEEISNMKETEFNEIVSKIENPTLNREEIVNSKFSKLLTLYSNRDKLKKTMTNSSSLLSNFPNLIPTDPLLPYSEAELAIRQRHHSKIMGKLGSNLKNIYKPHKLITNSPNINQISIEKLLSSGAHLGRSVELLNNNFQPFIYGKYKGLHLIDLDKTSTYLKNSCKIIEKIVENGGLVLFLGLKIGQLRSIKEAANKCNGFYVSRKWIPGSITNSLENPKPRIEIDMEDLPTNRELTTDEENKVIKPDLIVILNPENATVAIKEANQARIPTIGIIDSNVDPNLVTYPIPANSNSTRVTNLIVGVLGKSGEIGLQNRLQKVKEYKKSLGMEINEPFIKIDKISN